ncbi:MAG: hypothetical protein U1E50_09775 [Caulobacteraceae bacterium]
MASTHLRLLAACALSVLAVACSKPAATPKAAPEDGKAPAAADAGDRDGGDRENDRDAGPAPVEGAEVPDDQLGDRIEMSDLPRVRAGLWSVVDTTGTRETRDKECESGRPQELELGDNCSRPTVRRTLSGGFYITARCEGEDGTARVTMHAEGDFRTRYVLDSKLVVSGRRDQTIISHRVGTFESATCPAGMRDSDDEGNDDGDRRSSRNDDRDYGGDMDRDNRDGGH